MKKIFSILLILWCTSLLYGNQEDDECLLGNCKNGLGALTLSDDSTYIGECKNNMPEGTGVKFLFDGSENYGLFEDGTFTELSKNDTSEKCKESKCKKKFEIMFNEDRTLYYVGRVNNNLPNGEGIQRNSNGWISLGKFKNGIPDGKCDQYFSDEQGSFKYTGEIKNGERYKGKLIFKFNENGIETITTYIGYWKKNMLDGKGKSIVTKGEDSREYEGDFIDGKRHGHGTIKFSSGDKYIGEFKNDNINGKGTYIFPNGTKYIGGFRDGKYHGQGTLYNPDGTIEYKGRWIDNKAVNE